MREHLLRILACYIVGIMVGNVVLMPLLGPIVIFTMIGGVLAGLPELAAAIGFFILFRRSILRHLLPCCVIAPFLVTAVWLAVEWYDGYSWRGHDIYWYLSLRGTWERAALAFSSALFGAALFCYWTRRSDHPDFVASAG